MICQYVDKILNKLTKVIIAAHTADIVPLCVNNAPLGKPVKIKIQLR